MISPVASAGRSAGSEWRRPDRAGALPGGHGQLDPNLARSLFYPATTGQLRWPLQRIW